MLLFLGPHFEFPCTTVQSKITKVKFDKTITNFLSKIYELKIDITSYDIKKLDVDCNMLIFTRIYQNNHLTKLPPSIKVIYFS